MSRDLIPLMYPEVEWVEVTVVCARCGHDFKAGHLCPPRASHSQASAVT